MAATELMNHEESRHQPLPIGQRLKLLLELTADSCAEALTASLVITDYSETSDHPPDYPHCALFRHILHVTLVCVLGVELVRSSAGSTGNLLQGLLLPFGKNRILSLSWSGVSGYHCYSHT
jgi:hypothetical protein